MQRLVIAALAAASTVGAAMLATTPADAQASCPRCARQATLEACITCNMAAGPWNRKQSINWCTKMMAQCRGR